ncbi:hypothetical protein LTR37_008432 [Vermiconidia calcicola]|uniref:Uncharacterized protein n=1 Tax=Vermiconidia calcicola TaxID=1690605 RepID=A0ACC3NAQ3_9PEZI|nr:hypothetical protein LTR37_008432 [Vermiconidia calcicola]
MASSQTNKSEQKWLPLQDESTNRPAPVVRSPVHDHNHIPATKHLVEKGNQVMLNLILSSTPAQREEMKEYRRSSLDTLHITKLWYYKDLMESDPTKEALIWEKIEVVTLQEDLHREELRMIQEVEKAEEVREDEAVPKGAIDTSSERDPALFEALLKSTPSEIERTKENLESLIDICSYRGEILAQELLKTVPQRKASKKRLVDAQVETLYQAVTDAVEELDVIDEFEAMTVEEREEVAREIARESKAASG